jgi:hypothetical protein
MSFTRWQAFIDWHGKFGIWLLAQLMLLAINALMAPCRRLTWIYSLGNCIVKGNFDAKTIDMTMSTMQVGGSGEGSMSFCVLLGTRSINSHAP